MQHSPDIRHTIHLHGKTALHTNKYSAPYKYHSFAITTVRVTSRRYSPIIPRKSRRRPSEAIIASCAAQVSDAHNIGTASRVQSVFRELRICLKYSCMFRDN